MEITELKSYSEVYTYAKNVGYENLTDDDIEKLCNKIKEIRDNRIENHKKKSNNSNLRIFLINMEYSISNNNCYQLRRCTPEREYVIRKKLSKEQELAIYKEAASRNRNTHKVFLR